MQFADNSGISVKYMLILLLLTNVADLLLVQMTISGENSYLDHIFQDVG